MEVDLNVEEMMTDSLADIPKEGTDPISETDEQVETPAESPTEKETEESPSQEGEEAKESTEETTEEKSEEVAEEEPKAEDTLDANENVPFHKNPRWKKMREDNKALEAKVAELTSMTEKVTQLEEKVSGIDQGTTVPAEFRDIFDTVEQYNNWQRLQKGQKEGIKKEILSELEATKKAEQDAVAQQQNAIQENISHIEDEFDVKLPEKSSLRNEYMKFMWDYQPTTDGNLDFAKGWELFSDRREAKTADKSTSEARKKVVAKTASDRTAETPKSDVFELGDFVPNQFKQH